MVTLPYSYQMMVLGGVGWDRKEFPESDLHMYGKDDAKIIVYNMERWLKEGTQKKDDWGG